MRTCCCQSKIELHCSGYLFTTDFTWNKRNISCYGMALQSAFWTDVQPGLGELCHLLHISPGIANTTTTSTLICISSEPPTSPTITFWEAVNKQPNLGYSSLLRCARIRGLFKLWPMLYKGMMLTWIHKPKRWQMFRTENFVGVQQKLKKWPQLCQYQDDSCYQGGDELWLHKMWL